jgi:DNA-binding transcriptional MerR regulator/methylmalonyl-CoA mutase cobalamin-binding subunit
MPIGRVVETVRRTYPEVSPSSLRFLEREGLIEPTRTPGGHRLYSEADVERIMQIKAWQAQRLSLEEIHERLRQRDTLTDPGSIARHFLDQVLAGDGSAATATILDADALGLSLERLFGEVIEPALIEVGERWEHGTVLVAQEKMVSELVRDLVAELSIRHVAPRPDAPEVVAACVSGERHELGLRMLVGLLRADGYRVQYLGADVASEFLADAVRQHRPAAVLLSARFPTSEPALAEAIAAVRAVTEDATAIVVGGRLAAERGHRIAALGAIPIASEHLADALATLREILPPVDRGPEAI